MKESKSYKYDVFISHSTKDKIKADAICHVLEEHKIRCWYGPRDIPPGANWDEEITRAISSSRVFLLIFGENTSHSIYVKKELNLAVKESCYIIPFMIDGTQPEGAFAFHLADVNWIDGVTNPFIDRVKEVAETIYNIIYNNPINETNIKYITHNNLKKSNINILIRKPTYMIIAVIAILLIICGIFGVSLLFYEDGTAEHPYKISTPEQLDNIRNDLSAHYILIDDIDLSSIGNWKPIGNNENPFTGSLDGDKHTIKGMITDNDFVCLFNCGKGCKISDIYLKDIDEATNDAIHHLIRYYDESCSLNNCIIILGYGTFNNPYQISTPEQLNNIQNDLSAYYLLTDDIDLGNSNWVPIGSDMNPFTGSLNGFNHTIKGLTVSCDNDYIGLFGYGSGCILSNLYLDDIQISGNDYVGSLIGSIHAGTVTNCIVISGDIGGNYYVGGLIGEATSIANDSGHIKYGKNTVTACGVYEEVQVSGVNFIGGLIGSLYWGVTECCWSKAKSVNGYGSTGGLIGYLHYASIINSYADSEVYSLYDVGGLVGYISSGTLIYYCYATGGDASIIDGRKDVGGLIGGAHAVDYTIDITSSLSTMSTIKCLSATPKPHRILGTKQNSDCDISIENCYAYINMKLNGETVNSVGNTTENGESVLENTIKYEKDFYEKTLGFDFVNVWKEQSNGSLPPILQVELN